MLLAAHAPAATGRIFNVVDPQIVTQGDYLARVKGKLGDELKLLRVPTGVFMALAAGVELLGKLLHRSVPLTRYRVRSLRPLANFDISAARSGLGWEPRIGLQKGFERMFATNAQTDNAPATKADDA